ncbi:MAG TPA: polyprenyl synthetase family protein [Myxococcota bacterium]|nr:polyprenyl synthetase family protein [Myxococcota bacterium]
MIEALKKPKILPFSPVSRAHALVAGALRRVEQDIEAAVASTVELVPEVAKHLIDSGGKRIRPTLLLLMAQTAGAEARDGIDLSVATELFHNASLLHDDVVDRGNFRRGVPAAPRVYGNAASVLVGDFMMARAFGIVVKHGDVDLLDELSRVISSMAEGEVLQLVRSGRATLSLPGYEQIISGKTAGLFAWCCRAGASLARVGRNDIEAATELGRAFGMAFQITDDVLDYIAPPEQSGKDLANDLLQGKTTLPLLLACEEDAGLHPLIEDISARQPDEHECLMVVERVLATKSLKRALDKATIYSRRAADQLKCFSASRYAESIGELLAFVTERVVLPGS